MSVDFFLKLDGIKGETKDHKAEQAFDLTGGIESLLNEAATGDGFVFAERTDGTAAAETAETESITLNFGKIEHHVEPLPEPSEVWLDLATLEDGLF